MSKRQSPLLTQDRLTDSEVAEIVAGYINLVENAVEGLRKKDFRRIPSYSKELYGCYITRFKKSLADRVSGHPSEWNATKAHEPEENLIRRHIKSSCEHKWDVCIHYLPEVDGFKYKGISIFLEFKIPYFSDFEYIPKKSDDAAEAA